MSSIISEETISKLELIKRSLLRVAIWTLVGGVILGAVSILLVGHENGVIALKLMGTVLILGLMLLISVDNFQKIASRNAAIQVFALIGLIMNLVWAVLWIILCWMPELRTDCSDGGWITCHQSILLKVALSTTYLSAMGLFGSNILSINEGEKRSIILPLKITALVCVVYECVYGIVFTVMNVESWFRNAEIMLRLGLLSGFVGVAAVVLTLVAFAISRVEKNRLASAQKSKRAVVGGNGAQIKTEDELRAEIEEKVRREMIEEEVRKKFSQDRDGQS